MEGKATCRSLVRERQLWKQRWCVRFAKRENHNAGARNIAPTANRSTAYAWRLTGNTIALIAAKPANWRLPSPKPMNNPAIVCDCGTDPRLVAGIAAIACHVAKHAQWNHESQERVADSIARACSAAFTLVGNGRNRPAHVHVMCGPLADHIEVSVEFDEEIPQAKIKALGQNGPFRLTHYETGNAHSKLKFVELRDVPQATA